MSCSAFSAPQNRELGAFPMSSRPSTHTSAASATSERVGGKRGVVLATYAATGKRNVVHVQPCGDLIEHSDGFACVCGPMVEAVAIGLVCESGASSTHVGWLVTHHALDGRA